MRAELGRVTLPQRTVLLYRVTTVFAAVMLVVLSAIARNPLIPFAFWCAWALLFSLFPYLPRTGARREVEVTPRPGALDVREGDVTWSIKGRDVEAASTARRERKISLALGRKSRVVESPITLDFDNEKDASAAREALGLGHFGHGSLAWPLTGPAGNVVARMMGAGLLSVGLFLVGLGLKSGADASALILFGMMLGSVGGLLVTFGPADIVPTLYLRSDGLHWRRGNDWSRVDFANILATSVSDALYVWTNKQKEPWRLPLRKWALGGWGLTRAQAEHIAAQIDAAARRARGEGDFAPEVSPSVELLARAESETYRAWLERLDGAAAALGAGAGYRGGALTEEELWSALENPDAIANIRAAAARVLATRGPEARARIETIAARERDERVEQRIRIAVQPDVDEAAWDLADFEDGNASDKLLRKPRSH
ncbi:MAG: hypothetical protein JWM74_4941 [Myxococcaceae bacterium]|nr:hypothetical protein [Myxococcaceae bacterium]